MSAGKSAESPLVVVVDTGRSNAASLMAALERAGATTRLSTDPNEIRQAGFAVLPGVGAFGPVADRLRAMGVDSALRERVERNAPTLGACLGMQLFFASSEESPGVRGIDAIPGTITRYPAQVRSPQFGWNRVSLKQENGQPQQSAGILSGSAAEGAAYAYFANSYKLDQAPPGWTASVANYGGSFVAAIERGTVLLCQFHPELSGAWGQGLLARWLACGAGKPFPVNAPVPGTDFLAKETSVNVSTTLPRIIPCLDVANGRVVKGVRFQELRDSGDPAELSARYEAMGADEIVLLDITAGVDGKDTAVENVRAVRRRIGLPLCVGGGVRSLADAERILTAGADKVSLNSMAYRNPALLSEIAREFGRQCCVTAVDVSRKADGSPRVVLDAGRTETDTDAIDWIKRAVDAGAGEILLTSRDRDGTRSGYDLELLDSASRAVPHIPVIASGGAASPEQILDGLKAGASAALLAGALHDGSLTIASIKNHLRRNGVEAR
jgi:imidazole glycerol phosphate synthase glutamine amidotransferase subunit